MKRIEFRGCYGSMVVLAAAGLLLPGCNEGRGGAPERDRTVSPAGGGHGAPDAANEPQPAGGGPKEQTATAASRSPSETPPTTRSAAVDKSANAPVQAGDWPQWGGSSYRNNVPQCDSVPAEWDVGHFDRKTGQWIKDKAKNIKWVAALGDVAYGNPVVAGGKVYVGTNNAKGYLKRYPPGFDLGCLLCFQESDGAFLWQHSSEKLASGNAHDWEQQGICCSPYVEGDRLWFVTSRGEVRCLDAQGFYDGEDDGPVQNEWGRLLEVAKDEDAAKDELAEAVAALEAGRLSDSLRTKFEQAGAALPESAVVQVVEKGAKWSASADLRGSTRQWELRLEGSKLVAFKRITADDKDEADVVWVFDMMAELGVQQHNMCSCSVTALGDLLFVNTSNGVDEMDESVAAPQAPSFLAMDKRSGQVLWTDNSPGDCILNGQWSSPAAAVSGGQPQVIFAGGDAWLYSFRADRGKDGRPELLWKFDCNPKESKWVPDGRGERNEIIGTPVIYDGLVYVAVGRDPEQGDGVGGLWCIDPTRRGDVSSELAVRKDDANQTIPRRRLQAVIAEQGEVAVKNPNSAAVWCFRQHDANGDGKFDFEEQMHRSLAMPCIKDDLLFIADFAGLFHCLDAKTGKPHWSYDMFAAAWGSALIAAGHVYIGDEDGDVAVFRLSADPKTAMKKGEEAGKLAPMAEIPMGSSIYSSPIVANGVLFISTRDRLFAIQGPAPGK